VAMSDSLVHFLERNGYCTYNIVQYHDQQRLSKGNEPYGPVAMVFALDHVVSREHNHFDAGYRNVAVAYVKTSDSPGNSLTATYRNLGLRDSITCIYLRHRHQTGRKDWWEAATAPPQGDECTGTTEVSLDVRHIEPYSDPAAYPPVARFVESHGRRPMIGIRCATGWCFIGANRFADILPPIHAGLPGAGLGREWTVPGWFDEQHLAVKDGNRLHPRFRLSIVPTEDLANADEAAYARPSGVHVATIIVPPHVTIPPQYARTDTGYGLRPGANRVYIFKIAENDWRAHIVNSSFPQGTPHRRVKRRDHSHFDYAVPPTARWRWVDTDEEIWVACAAGCCMIEPQS
jgi:hypothetical protein